MPALYIGLDVHKASIAMALTFAGDGLARIRGSCTVRWSCRNRNDAADI